MKALAAVAAAAALAHAAPAHSQTTVDPKPKVAEMGPEVSETEAVAKAKTHPQAIEALRDPKVYPSAFRSDSDRDWEVGFFKQGADQVLQVVVDDESGEIEEVWTGEQISWKMARGYPGAFGRTVNAPYVWLPLCGVFLLLLFDWRRPFRVAHLDLLVLVAGFGVSHYFFNLGKIGLSVPLAYPALLYLLARTLWLGFRGGDGLRPSLPTVWIAIAVIALLGFRAGLNVTDSNVIDVGYAGVIGADKVSDGEPLYGDFPQDNSHGDTYGPLAYYAYQPFEQVLPWSGEWDDLPAAHAASIFFDLATAALLLWLGMRLRPGPKGRRLGTLLAAGWAACPYTAFALESNTNDSLVSLLLTAALLFLTSPPARGALLALATLTKFAPIALAPLFLTYDRSAHRTGGTAGGPTSGALAPDVGGTAVTGPVRRVVQTWGGFIGAFALTTALVMAVTLVDPGLSTFWDRTVGNQAGRDSPFSVWGQVDLDWLHTIVKALAIALAVFVAFRPKARGPVTVAALGAAVMIAVQLTVEHWFYLYIPWFLPFLLVALLARNELSPAPIGSASRGERPGRGTPVGSPRTAPG